MADLNDEQMVKAFMMSILMAGYGANPSRDELTIGQAKETADLILKNVQDEN
jgi:hypothetical protein